VWSGDYIGFIYPPFAALTAAPFALLPQQACRAAWYLVNVICIALWLRWSWRLSGGGSLQFARATDPKEHVVCFLGLVGALSYAVNCLAHQQSDLVIAALIMGGCMALSRSRGWLGATAFGLAAAMKCTALLWSPYLLWRGRWKEALWLVCVAVGVNLLPNLVSAPEPGKLYLTDWASRFLAPMQRSYYYPGVWATAPIFNQSLAGTAFRWNVQQGEWAADEFRITDRPNPLSPWTLKFLVYGADAALVLGMLFVLGRRPLPKFAAPPASSPIELGMEFSVILLLMLFLSPMSNTQHFVILLLPAFCLARLAVRQRRRTAAVLLFAAVAVRALEMKWLWGERFSTMSLWLGNVTCSALFLLLGCAWVLVTRPRSVAARQGFRLGKGAKLPARFHSSQTAPLIGRPAAVEKVEAGRGAAAVSAGTASAELTIRASASRHPYTAGKSRVAPWRRHEPLYP
jgi:hypothetical protein